MLARLQAVPILNTQRLRDDLQQFILFGPEQRLDA